MDTMKTISNMRAELFINTLHDWEDGIEVSEMHTDQRDKSFQLGVNWSAIGISTPEETMKYMHKVEKAARIAERINSLEVSVEIRPDEFITTDEEYYAAKDALREAFEKGYETMLVDFIRLAIKEA